MPSLPVKILDIPPLIRYFRSKLTSSGHLDRRSKKEIPPVGALFFRIRAWLAERLHSASADVLEAADRDVLADFSRADPTAERFRSLRPAPRPVFAPVLDTPVR